MTMTMTMIVSPSVDRLHSLVRQQVENQFILDAGDEEILTAALPATLIKVEKCFTQSPNKYYRKNDKVFFSVYHSGQYCVFLYILAREIFLSFPEQRLLADKLYCLNKALNGLDLFYEVEMPSIFHLDHPVGSVMGRATYGDNFSFTQCCTVGNNKGSFPIIGKNVQMMSGSKILGKCLIGNDVIVSANAYIKETNIPNNSLVFGCSPNLVIKPRRIER